MSDNADDPVLAHLRARQAELQEVRADATARLAEVELLIATLQDGRTRVRRRLKEAAPPGNGASEPTTVPADPTAAA